MTAFTGYYNGDLMVQRIEGSIDVDQCRRNEIIDKSKIMMSYTCSSLQDRQLAKNIFFLVNNFSESGNFSHDELIRVVTCRQMGHRSCQ